jgi:hypothetical protein
MKLKLTHTCSPLLIGAVALFCAASHALTQDKPGAGDGKQTADAKESKAIETPAPENPWQVKLAIPGWIAGISGDTGVRGFNTHVNISATEVLKKLDSTASFAGEVRRGRFGAYADFLYLNVSDTVPANGIIAGTAVRLEQYLADFDLNYRIVEGPRGWVDALAGVRFTSISEQVNIYPDVPAINAASTDLVDKIAAQINADVKALVTADLDNKLSTLKSNHTSLPTAPLAAPLLAPVEAQVTQIIQAQKAALASAIAANDISKINTLKAALAQRITNTIAGAIAQPHNQTNEWFDPYVGLRARLNLYKQVLYLTGKADVGGFDAGSKITWEACGALGCQLTRNIYAEAGYKYLYVDYDSGGFLYKVATRGAEVTVGVNF